MKSVLAIAAMAALASAQDFKGQPECAIGCLAKAIPQTSCAMTDQACQCRPDIQAQLVPLVAGCLVSSCTKEGELQQAQAAGAAACAAYAASYSASAPAPAIASSTSSGAPESTPWTYPAMSMPMPMPTTSGGPVPTVVANHTSSGAPHSSGTGATPSQSVVPAGAAGAVIPVLAGGVAAVVAMAANL